jgi:hypothetical protein
MVTEEETTLAAQLGYRGTARCGRALCRSGWIVLRCPSPFFKSSPRLKPARELMHSIAGLTLQPLLPQRAPGKVPSAGRQVRLAFALCCIHRRPDGAAGANKIRGAGRFYPDLQPTGTHVWPARADFANDWSQEGARSAAHQFSPGPLPRRSRAKSSTLSIRPLTPA